MNIKTYLVALMLVAGASVNAEELGFEGESSACVGIYVKNIQSGEVLVSENADMTLTPASIMKCVTTASVLSTAGTNRHFSTDVALAGRHDGHGHWEGNLIVRASGDPTLESDNFRSTKGFCDSIVAHLRRAGVKSLKGRIVIEEDMPGQGPILEWQIEDIPWPYGAGLHALNWRDNCVRVFPNTGRTVPEAPGLEIDLRRVDSGSALVRGAFSDKLIVYASNRRDDYAVTTTVPNPSAVFGAELIAKMNRNGIEFETSADVPDGETIPIYNHRSVDYGQIMRSLMVRSDNLFAEGMLRTLAPGSSRRAAISRECDLWNSRGISTKTCVINDGSGLTRSNRFSPKFLGQILEYMVGPNGNDAYTGFFPRVGKEGTVRGFLSNSPLKGTIGLKTGSVSTVQCYAGYRFGANGKPTHVIVIMVNGFTCPRAQIRKGAERMLERLFR